ncbi:hypothetical protein KJY77_06290 [Canibacter sp. lx-72]|uniref:hypothetical protein n=1 Tax=Canibacter zhuwentaonis TaxID=2837491 RepID=UPI001BDD0715|nr:hypothetical protein [Canibacter zhuwentaonis]MBT1018393.1 hypothetical protein [Canibacter zhuwentaonis]MBT1018738.1 hypothetical protein [Canibacter zhuwentaonis]
MPGFVSFTGSVVCNTDPRWNKDFSFDFGYAYLQGRRVSRLFSDQVWSGSDCVVTVYKGDTPAGWVWMDKTPVVLNQRNVQAAGGVLVGLDVVRVLVNAPPLLFTGGVASDWVYLTGVGVLVASVVAGLVVRRRLRAEAQGS